MTRKFSQSNLSEEDRVVLRRWTRGVWIFYSAVLLCAISVVVFSPYKSNDLTSTAAIGSPVVTNQPNR